MYKENKMKNTILAAVAATMLASTTAFAGSADKGMPLPDLNPYVEITTDSDSVTELSAGTSATFYGNSTYFKARVDNSDVDREYGVTGGVSRFIYGNLKADVFANYDWGYDGKDMLGFGEENTWGDTQVGGGLTYYPGLVGGEYVFGEVTYNVTDLATYDHDSTVVGAGYEYRVNDMTTLDVNVSTNVDGWNVNTNDYIVGAGIKVNLN
jgi:hypothetical protein